jgi:3'-phosphoadenosine 5'-phosphosulfate sulfotransferase (PAPS reductase)/FAD synthetase
VRDRGFATHVVNISGGKDSTAAYLLALESGVPFRAVMADTGHEHEKTMEFVATLAKVTGGPEVEVVKAEFTNDFARKRYFIAKKWPSDLVAGRAGRWVWTGNEKSVDPPPPAPTDVYAPAAAVGQWAWKPGCAPISADEAAERVALALEILTPTGIPFLDLCLVKGRFPSQGARFCTEELKVLPMWRAIYEPLLKADRRVISWHGVRADESRSRSKLSPRTHQGGKYWIWRPLLRWTAQDVFTMHSRHGVAPNPLYQEGMGRVGCFPCFGCRKEELGHMVRRYPKFIETLKRWEKMVGQASKCGQSTFFAVDKIPGPHQRDSRLPMPGIERVAAWALTGPDGWTLDLLKMPDEGGVYGCTSLYGLCE